MKQSDIKWKEACHWNLSKSATTMYLDKALGVEHHATVRKINHGMDFGKQTDEYYITGSKEVYKTVEQLIIAYNASKSRSL